MRFGGRTAFDRFRVAAMRRGGSASGTVLQPVLHDPIAAWALLDEDDGSSATMLAAANVDRVSGAYPLTRTAGTVWASPDLIKQYRCPHSGASARPLGRDASYGSGVDAALKLTGELTISMRAWWSGGTTIAYPALIDVSEAFAARSAGNGECQCFFRIYIDTANGGKIGGYHQRALGGYNYADVGFTSSLTMTPGRWHYLALRRSAAGAYTITRDEDQETSADLGSLPNPAYGAGALNIGQWGSVQLGASSIYAGNDPWLGGYADAMIWNKRLADDEVQNQRAVMFDIEAAA